MADYRDYYSSGSEARNTVSEPLRRERKTERKTEVHSQPRKKQQKRVKANAAARVKASNSLAFDWRYTILLVTMLLAMVIAGFVLISIQGKVEKQRRHVRSLEQSIQTLSEKNSDKQEEIDQKYSPEEIKSYAENNLGMVQADSDQVMKYDVEQDDYVNQMTDVPTGDK